MRLFYCDPGLTSDVGHHAQSCRALVGEARSRGIETLVYAAADVAEGLRTELGIRALFRASPYWQTDGDPICGWLTAFGLAVQATLEDLRSLHPLLQPGDVLYLNSGQAPQLMALASWLGDAEAPGRVAIEFGVDPGLDVIATPQGSLLQVRDPRVDPKGVLYRYVGKHIAPEAGPRLAMLTFDRTASEVYGELIGRPVEVAPVPRGRTFAARDRVPGAPITIAVLGHQRREKGYQYVPEVFAALAARFPGLRLLAHNAQPSSMKEVQGAMRALAAREPRVVIDERVADGPIWDELLAQSDLILCPYEPARYALSYSAVASEAMAHGIPLVVPAGTTLARVTSEYGAGTAYQEWSAAAITDAAATAIATFDEMAGQAAAGAERWARDHGPTACLTALLRLLGVG